MSTGYSSFESWVFYCIKYLIPRHIKVFHCPMDWLVAWKANPHKLFRMLKHVFFPFWVFYAIFPVADQILVRFAYRAFTSNKSVYFRIYEFSMFFVTLSSTRKVACSSFFWCQLRGIHNFCRNPLMFSSSPLTLIIRVFRFIFEWHVSRTRDSNPLTPHFLSCYDYRCGAAPMPPVRHMSPSGLEPEHCGLQPHILPLYYGDFWHHTGALPICVCSHFVINISLLNLRFLSTYATIAPPNVIPRGITNMQP